MRERSCPGGPDATPAAGVVHAEMELEGQTPVGDGDDPRPRRTIFSFVGPGMEDEGRCASAQSTDVVLGAETNVVDDRGGTHPVSYRPGTVPDPN